MSTHNGNSDSKSGNNALLTRSQLMKLRQKAQRHGTWYKILNTIERSLVDLAIATVNKIRSWTLAKSLTIVVKKLQNTIETNTIQRQIQTIGLPLAKRLSKIAQHWGNKSAANWVVDNGFAEYLAICTTNTSG